MADLLICCYGRSIDNRALLWLAREIDCVRLSFLQTTDGITTTQPVRQLRLFDSGDLFE